MESDTFAGPPVGRYDLHGPSYPMLSLPRWVGAALVALGAIGIGAWAVVAAVAPGAPSVVYLLIALLAVIRGGSDLLRDSGRALTPWQWQLVGFGVIAIAGG